MFLRENSSSTSQQPNTPNFIHTVNPDMFLRENSSNSTTQYFMNRAGSFTRLESIVDNPTQFQQNLIDDLSSQRSLSSQMKK